jgi:hypothetical protein
MAKGAMRPNKEKRKPKKEEPKANASNPSLISTTRPKP